jgi:hypothetical protein
MLQQKLQFGFPHILATAIVWGLPRAARFPRILKTVQFGVYSSGFLLHPSKGARLGSSPAMLNSRIHFLEHLVPKFLQRYK